VCNARTPPGSGDSAIHVDAPTSTGAWRHDAISRRLPDPPGEEVCEIGRSADRLCLTWVTHTPGANTHFAVLSRPIGVARFVDGGGAMILRSQYRSFCFVALLFIALAVAASLPFGCAPKKADPTSSTGSSSGGNGGSSAASFSSTGGQTVISVTVDPPDQTLVISLGMKSTQAYTASAHMSDGSTEMLSTGITWGSDSPAVGQVDGTGTYTTTGNLGGNVTIQATYGGLKGSATLHVQLVLKENPGNVPANVVTALEGANAPDPGVVWAYPYDGTVWPRGLLPPLLQWNGGGASDIILVHLKNPTFDLEQVGPAMSAPSSQLAIDAMTWQMFVDSSSGPTSVTVARWNGQGATVIASHTWGIAPQSMRGTIYYWSNDLGRVLRIQPGAATPDDFANIAPLNDPAQYQPAGCLMTCHTVSADGSTLISGGGTYGGSYDLKNSKPIFSLGGTWGINPNGNGQPEWVNPRWGMSALSPDGKYVLSNSMAQGLMTAVGGPSTGDMELFTSADGMPVAQSGVSGKPFAMPAWSPEGSVVAFVDAGDPAGWFATWNTPPPGDLKVMQFNAASNPMFSAPTTMVSVGTTSQITWPTITPDGKWILYARATAADTRQGNGDLYIASATAPNQEQRLAALDGDNYPFAAGARDLHLNFEPSFAPVAAGGYFWVVFTSRRTYGNSLTADQTKVKQLWVAAIDQNPVPGKDPSHPPFHLTGQAANLAMRGFWSLPPCKSDAQSCQSGTDCCGGYCNQNGTCTSTSTGCSQNGDKCNTAADCCNAANGVTCINHVCSEPPPM
jgi:hypothetical protein